MPENIVPPNDLDAEAAVLSAVLLDSDRLDDVIDLLRPDDFYSHANGRIYEAFLALRVMSKPIDVLTVRGRLDDLEQLQKVGGSAYLADILDKVPAVANVRTYAQRVFEMSRLRRLIGTCRRISAEGYGPVDRVPEFIGHAAAEIQAIHEGTVTDGLVSFSNASRQAFEELREQMRAKAEGRSIGVRCGIQPIDQIIGGWRAGTLGVIAARTSVGKTAFVLNSALEAATSEVAPRCGVLVVSMETLFTNVAMRMNCTAAGVQISKVVRAEVSAGAMHKLVESAKRLNNLPVLIASGTPGLPELAAYICLARRKFRNGLWNAAAADLGLVIIDYLQLGRMDQPARKTREQAVSEFVRGLKNLAVEHRLPILAVSQLNRALETRSEKRPTLADLRESGEIEAAADTVILLYRSDYHTGRGGSVVEAEAIIAKSKDTETGTVKLTFDKETLLFTAFDSNAVRVSDGK